MIKELNFETKENERVCSLCMEPKPLSEFYTHKGRAFKRCKECERNVRKEDYYNNGGKEKALKRYHSNPELQKKTRERAMKRWRANKERANELRRQRRKNPAYKEKERAAGRRYWHKKYAKKIEARERKELERLKIKYKKPTKGSNQLRDVKE